VTAVVPDERGRARRWQDEPSGLPYEPFQLTGVQVRRAAEVFRSRGVVVLGPDVLDPWLFADLARECRAQRRIAAWTLGGPDGRASVDQDTVRAHLGPLARELCAAGATRALLHAVTGDAVLPGWSATCLTFYDRAGQYLTAHRDKIDACHHAFLLYLDVRWTEGAQPGPGLALHVCAPDSDEVMLRVTAAPNRLVVLHGSRLTHFRPPLAEGEAVSLIAGCFSLADTTGQ
jgi:hypothetical protein